jgi:F-type H+-transporting ATPase subunit b
MTPEHQTATVAVEPAASPPPGGGSALFSLNPGMILWTWIIFGTLALLLYKFAWKPILNGLAAREKKIRESLENAERIKQEMETLARKQQEVLSQAHAEGLSIVRQGREQAEVLSKTIVDQAKEEAAMFLSQAQKEIAGETERARQMLRAEAATLAVAAASKLVQASLDDARHRDLAAKYIKEL